MAKHPTFTAVFILLERDGKYFFIRRANTGWNDGKLTLPSGHVDKGQTARQAATVEAREEAGVVIHEEDLEFIHCHYIFDTYTNFYFRAKKWEGEPMLGEPHLCSEVVWHDKEHIPDDVIMHVRSMLENVGKGSYFTDKPDDPGWEKSKNINQ